MNSRTLHPTSSTAKHLGPTILLSAFALLLAPTGLEAGGTPATGAVTDQLLVANGTNIGSDIGDFVSAAIGGAAADDGLDEPYKYFLEVSPDVDRLVVQIFDPDVVANASSTTELDNDRDLLRGTRNTWALYSLYDPSGNRVPVQFGVGSGTVLPAWDNAWVTLYDSQNATITTGDTFADNFSTQVYTRNDGTVNWATDWIEENDTGVNSGAGPTAGLVQIAGNELTLSNEGDTDPFNRHPSIYREVDLSGYTSAILSFDWNVGGNVEDEDAAGVQVSGDGGVTWVRLDIINQFDSIASSGSRSYDISPYIASNTRIRFRIFDIFAATGAGNREEFHIDNVQILASTGTSSTSPEDGHWELRMDVSSDISDRSGRQNELNAFGVRAHDGTPGAGGEEVNVYALSFVTFGLNATERTRSYQFYPYITEGCEFDVNDFDFDSGAADPDGVGGIDPPYGSWDLTSRLTTFTDDEGGTLSTNNAWLNSVVTGWTSSNTADDYGIWDLDISISDFGVGNYADVYLGQEEAANPDPTANPEDNTFRIYFPNDAGTAPAKPYFSQRVTHAGLGNGPNPPVMGSTSRFAVTLSITNPTDSIGDITFSSSNLITANIPGDTTNARVRYQGVQTGFPTAGSIVSQPTIGNTTPDDIEWNPGTIAPGNTETLVYFFDLEPLVATNPLTIPVTGGYGTANGSRAVFIDETGASASSFNFGNLCGLDVIAGAGATSTPVLVSSFQGYDTRRGTLLEWSTAAEAGTVAYELYRHDANGRPVKVNGEPLMALLGPSQGGVYRFLDGDADPSVRHTYELVELDAHGRRVLHGPFPVEALTVADLPGRPYDRLPHREPERARPVKALEISTEEPQARAATHQSGERVNILTGEPGLYRVTAAELADLFGTTVQRAKAAIRTRRLELSHLGEPVAWLRGSKGTYFEFYAEALDNTYTAKNVYKLDFGRGLLMNTLRGGPLPPAEWEPAEFRDTVRQEENLRQLVLAPLDPEGDIFFWDFVNPPAGGKTFGVEVPAAADTSGTALLTLDLQGAQVGSHTVEVSLNDQYLGEVSLQDFEEARATLEVSQSLLTAGTNTVGLTSTTGGLVFVDGIDLEYDRQFQADEDRLLLRGDGQPYVATDGFGDGHIRVFDLSDPKRPALLQRVQIADTGIDGYRVVFEPKDASTNYFAVSEGGVLSALDLQIDRPSDLRDTAHAVDYLVVTTEDLLPAAEALAAHREAKGLATLVVDLQDVYDEFADGLALAPALGDFLAYALDQWQRAPRYVVLAGAGTYDYHDHLGFGGNLIPTRLRSTGETLFATDHPYVELAGDNGVPEMILGRIPARTAAELATYVDKLIAYENLDAPDWGSEVLLASDNGDAIADFPAVHDALGDLIPVQYNRHTVALPDFGDLASARQALLDGFEEGAVLLSYMGHGGVDRMAAEGLLTSADVPALTNGERLPVVLAVSCHIGLHGLPNFDSLGEHLVLHEGGGAAAVWAPSWLSKHSQARFFGDRLLRGVFQNGERILGEAVLEALEAGADLGIEAHLLATYQLLGDPALELQLAPNALAGGGGCNDSCGEGTYREEDAPVGTSSP